MKAENTEPSIDKTLTLEQFQETVLQEQLTPLWMGALGQLREPRTHILPYLWRWKELRQRVLQSLKLIPLGVEGAERRVLTLRNPGISVPRLGTTHTLVAAIQIIAGTEVAPSHRHTMAALRFIIEGEGACTVVNGEPESMQPRDLLLTPNWYWHGHFSEHPEPMIWLDGLDVPLVQGLGATFQENYPSPDRRQPITAPRDESIRRYSAGGLLPVGVRTANKNSPLLNFRWAQTEDRLAQMAESDGSPYDGVALQYTNPFTGGPVMPTIDCWVQMLRPSEQTKTHRHTGSVIYHIVEGSGWTVINGKRFDWTTGDIFCIPPWAWHDHANSSSRQRAVLFSFADSPVLKAFDLYREEAYAENQGRQRVETTF
jgi:gentisate 1,2-dioxygenase